MNTALWDGPRALAVLPLMPYSPNNEGCQKTIPSSTNPGQDFVPYDLRIAVAIIGSTSHAILRLAADGGLAANTGLHGESQAGATPDAVDGTGDHLPAPIHQPACT